MEFIKYESLGRDAWDDYIEQIQGVTFSYTAINIEFELDFSETKINNESFLALQDNQPVAVVILYFERHSEEGTTTGWGGHYCKAPYVSKGISLRLREKYIKEIMFYIDNISEQYQCKDMKFRMDPLINPEQRDKLYNYNYMMKYGYKGDLDLSQMLDLRHSEQELYADIRKGHKSDIKRGKKYEIEIYDNKNMTKDKIVLYRKIYEEDAGRVTRNSQMYMHYYEFIRDKKGVIAFAKVEGEYVGVLIATFYKNTAYYSSYAERTNQLEGVPVGHVLQWETIKYLKQHGIEFYEMGEQVFGSYEKGTEEAKLVNIATYKRGFGGYTVPVFKGEKKMDCR